MSGASRRVVVGMSGGVDSAVTAALLKQQGYDVHGVFLCMGTRAQDDAVARSCCAPRDAADARRSAEQLDIPFAVWPIEEPMKGIVDYFVREYQRGRTPNPCPRCNADVKFAALGAAAEQLGADKIATGHYAEIRARGDEVSLHRGRNPAKDQSYVLFTLTANILSRLLLPLGEVADKQAVRELAAAFKLDVQSKADSQDICFVPRGGHSELLAQYGGPGLLPGPIEDPAGRILGTHAGYARYTVGQRRGLGVAAREPLYVLRIEPEANRVVLGPKSHLQAKTVEIRDAVWQTSLSTNFRALVQLRYRARPVAAQAARSTDGSTCRLDFNPPAPCAVPGQAAVLYDGDRVLGGGWIDKVEPIYDA